MAPPNGSSQSSKAKQTSISTFFQPPSTATKRECEVIELSSDDDDDDDDERPPAPQPAPKKLKLEDLSSLPATSSKPIHSIFENAKNRAPTKNDDSHASTSAPSTTASDRVSKWKFDPSSSRASGAGETAAPSTTDAARLARSLLGVTGAWRKSAYLQNPDYMAPSEAPGLSSAARGTGRREEQRDDDEEEGMELDSDEEGHDEDSDEEEEPLKGKGKGKGKATSKGKEREKISQLSKFALKASGDKAVKFTPLEQQVIALKKSNPGTLLAIEVGYKFKFYMEDAQTASRILGIACFPSQHMLVASIPTFRLNIHVKRLINAGHKVGIVRQVETAALKKVSNNKSGPFSRTLSAVYTSATWVDELNVDEGETATASGSAALLCIVEEPKPGGKVLISIVSVSPATGEIIHDSFEDGLLRSELETRVLHLLPSELLLCKISKESESMLTYHLGQGGGAAGMTCRIERNTEDLTTAKALAYVSDFYTKAGRLDQTQVVIDDSDAEEEGPPEASLSGGLTRVLDLPSGILRALAHLIKHLKAFKLDTMLLQTQSFVHFSSRSSMSLSGTTLTNLEILRNETDYTVKGSLISVLDHCRTAFGKRELRKWLQKPLLSVSAANDRLDAVAEILSSSGKASIVAMRDLFRGLPDLERGLVRVHLGRVTTSQELFRFLQAFQRVADTFDPDDRISKISSLKSPLLQRIAKSLPEIKEQIDGLLDQIDAAQARAGSKENLWKDPHRFEDVADARDCLHSVEAEILQELSAVRKLLRRPKLEFVKVGDEEYLIEVRIAEAKKLTTIDDWIKINSTKAVYRFRTPAMQKKIAELEQCREHLAKQAERAFSEFLKEISAAYEPLRAVIKNLATADCLFSFATVALHPGYTRPTILNKPGILQIEAGRHPIVEQLLPTYVPNDVSLGGTAPGSIILNGLNAGGKSSTSRMIALLALMAQVGSYVPADAMTTSMFDQIHTRFGASDELARGRSTFMVELSETSDILRASTNRSLIILDELGRGTSTNDGQAIASAVLQYIITTLKSLCIFVTHYPSLAELEKLFPGSVSCYHMACIERENREDGFSDVTFLYKLTAGLSSRSMGINVARMAGLPTSVVRRAFLKSQELEEAMKNRLIQRRAEKMAIVLRELVHPELAQGGLLAFCSQLLEDAA